MQEWLNTIMSRIADGTLLPSEYYRQLDCDVALDARDSDAEFRTEWGRQFDKVGRQWSAVEVGADVSAVAEDIRKQSFLAVSRATRQHEIASYVSDDIDLIIRGRLVGGRQRFLDQLWAEYERGRFPRPPFGEVPDAEPGAAADGGL